MQWFNRLCAILVLASFTSAYRARSAMLGCTSRSAAVETKATLIFVVSVVPHPVRKSSFGFSNATHCTLAPTIETRVCFYILHASWQELPMQWFNRLDAILVLASFISAYWARFAMLGCTSRSAAVKTKTTVIIAVSVVPHRVRKVSSGFSFATHCALVLAATIQTQVFF